MEGLKVFMQCAMLTASSADFIQALRCMKPRTALLYKGILGCSCRDDWSDFSYVKSQ